MTTRIWKRAATALALGATALSLFAVPAAGADPVEPTPGPTGYQCAGDPPRQTVDPLSPPCVTHFEGDNGCDTYGLGVECDEIRIAVVIDGGINYSSGSGLPQSSRNVAPQGRLYDLWKTAAENNAANGDPESREEHLTTVGLRGWQSYFAARFQSYGRSPHFFVYYSERGQQNAEGRREMAAHLRQEVDPFAVVSFASEGSDEVLTWELARKGVLTFGGADLVSGALARTFPKLVWSVRPTAEQVAEVYGSYVCQQVVGRAPVLAGTVEQHANSLLDGGARRLGIVHTTDARHGELRQMADLVKARVRDCGHGDTLFEATFPDCCLAHDGGEIPEYALHQMAEFKAQRVTTVLWAGGLNGQFAPAALALGYQPEWFLAGDGLWDANGPVVMSKSSAAFDGHAVVVTPEVVKPQSDAQLCWRLYREVDPTLPAADLGYVCDYYRDLHQLFVGIQVAGPYLGPTNFSKGMHAIPHRPSPDPQTPACFYLEDDYSCIKDAQAEYWSATSVAPGATTPGCWRPIDGGRRYGPGDWPAENVNVRITGTEPCNAHSASSRFNLS